MTLYRAAGRPFLRAVHGFHLLLSCVISSVVFLRDKIAPTLLLDYNKNQINTERESEIGGK